ncbi:hypothetical protein [Brevibacillus sp. H7]|uniref:hypothetical protein n=1 Tax=Brevibacillus sp. H7 TaxID=3349138 RepID=UPI0037FAF7CA
MIILDEYAGERHLVYEFVNHVHRQPLVVNDQPIHLFIWGYELWMPEGGKQGGAGIIDLMATDDQGRTWLIEAKHSLNFELRPEIWEYQVLNYRKTLPFLPVEKILLKTHKYLTGTPAEITPPFLQGGCESLLDAFIKWQARLGVDEHEQRAHQLYERTLNNVRQERVISTILADVFRQEVWEARPTDGHAYAYLVSTGVGNDYKAELLLTEPVHPETGIQMQVTSPTWAELWEQQKQNQQLPTPDVIRSLLSESAVKLFDDCLENMKSFGWNGEYSLNSKSFVVRIPTVYGKNLKLQMGLVDYDARGLTLQEKLPGHAGFKFDIDLSEFRTDPRSQDVALSIALRFIQEAGYRARGAGQRLGTRELSEKERNKWSWILHHDGEAWRDFTGRQVDHQHLLQVWTILQEIIIPSGQTHGSDQRKHATRVVSTMQDARELHMFIQSQYENAPDMKKLFMAMQLMLEQANLAMVYTGAKETVEIRLRDPSYPYAFGSIQYCRPKSGEYLELRFKRIHLQHVNALEAIDQLHDNPYRNDVKSSNPEAVRFHFKQFDDQASELIYRIGDILWTFTR